MIIHLLQKEDSEDEDGEGKILKRILTEINQLEALRQKYQVEAKDKEKVSSLKTPIYFLNPGHDYLFLPVMHLSGCILSFLSRA